MAWHVCVFLLFWSDAVLSDFKLKCSSRKLNAMRIFPSLIARSGSWERKKNIKSVYNSDRMCDYAAALCSQSQPETGTGLLIDWRCSELFSSFNLSTTSVPTSISIQTISSCHKFRFWRDAAAIVIWKGKPLHFISRICFNSQPLCSSSSSNNNNSDSNYCIHFQIERWVRNGWSGKTCCIVRCIMCLAIAQFWMRKRLTLPNFSLFRSLSLCVCALFILFIFSSFYFDSIAS